MITSTGKYIDIWNFKLEDIDIEDIIHALSLECRYTNHTKQHYSDAEHSIHVAHVCPKHLQPAGLLHDASEAYLGDLRPELKYNMPEYMMLEKHIQNVIYQSFGISLSVINKGIIKRCDQVVTATEIGIVIDNHPKFQELFKHIPKSTEINIQCWDAKTAKKKFRNVFNKLIQGV